MSNRRVVITSFALFMGLVLTAAAGAQTSVPAPSNPDTHAQAAPGTQPVAPAAPSSNTPATQNGAASQGAPSTGQSASSGQSGSGSVEDELQLTPDQKQKIAAVVEDENKQIGAVRDDNSLSMQQKQQKVMQIRQEGSPKIKAVLTPEQLQKLTAIQQRMHDQQQGSGAPQSAPQSPAPPSQTTPQR
jgi:Spy/CpxP family protein refolding chaperone